MSDPDDPFKGLPFFGDLARMIAGQGPLSWDAARQFAHVIATQGQPEANVDPLERLRWGELARVAELHVQQASGLAVSHTGAVVEVTPVTPGMWAARALDAYRPLFERLLGLGQPTGKTDFAFHRAIAAATNNPFYVEVLDALGTRTIPCDVTSPWGTDSVLTREYQEGLQREHLVILRAISRGDADAARDGMRAHLSASQQRYRERLNGRYEEYLSVLSKSNPA